VVGSPKKRAKRDVAVAKAALEAGNPLPTLVLHPIVADMDLQGSVTRNAPPHWDSSEARQLVIEWTVAGIEATKIAEYLGATYDQLQYRYRVELDTATQEVVARVGMSLVQKALTGDVQAQLGFLRHRGGDAWKEKKTVEINQTNTFEVKTALIDKVLALTAPTIVDVTPNKEE
jgi:hypothetical protein